MRRAFSRVKLCSSRVSFFFFESVGVIVLLDEMGEE